LPQVKKLRIDEHLLSFPASFPAFNSVASATNFVFVLSLALALSERSNRFVCDFSFCGFVTPLLK
jgi:hypothetical protein